MKYILSYRNNFKTARIPLQTTWINGNLLRWKCFRSISEVLADTKRTKNRNRALKRFLLEKRLQEINSRHLQNNGKIQRKPRRSTNKKPHSSWIKIIRLLVDWAQVLTQNGKRTMLIQQQLQQKKLSSKKFEKSDGDTKEQFSSRLR